MSEAEAINDGFRRNELCLTTPYVMPASDAETRLAEIWQRVLNVDIIGTEDDFFEIGGDSIAAAVLAGELEKCFGCKFSPSNIIDNSTIADQAAFLNLLKKETAAPLPAHPPYLTLFNAEGAKAPLFMVHGNRGFTIYHKSFLDGFDTDQPIGFLEAPGLDGKAPPLEGIGRYAKCYLDAIRQVAPDGNWQIASNCAGSLIALEMCCLAEKNGERVSRLMMIDPMNGRRAATKLWRRKAWYTTPKKGFRGLLSKLSCFLPTRLHTMQGDDESGYAASVDAFNQRRKHFEKRINQRTKGNAAALVPSRVAYSPEAMQNVCHALDKAYWSYVLHHSWSGQAFILTCHSRSNGLKVWRRYLPNVLCRIVAYNHQSLFTKGLPEVQKFLSHAMSPNPREYFQS